MRSAQTPAAPRGAAWAPAKHLLFSRHGANPRRVPWTRSAVGLWAHKKMAQAPRKDTGTAGTAECEAHADAYGAQGRHLDASEDFVISEKATASELDADGVAGNDTGMMATGGGGGMGACTAAARGHGPTWRRRHLWTGASGPCSCH